MTEYYTLESALLKIAKLEEELKQCNQRRCGASCGYSHSERCNLPKGHDGFGKYCDSLNGMYLVAEMAKREADGYKQKYELLNERVTALIIGLSK